MDWACGMDGERRGACRFLVEKPERMRILERPSHRWVNNTKIDL
jgi:hypothetical protein